jgi:arginine deiminase
LEHISPAELATTFISGIITYRTGNEEVKKFIFPPVPNFVFTRDIGIVIKDHLLVSKLAMQARKRESILMKFVSYYGLLKDDLNKIIEITEDSDFFLEDEDVQKLKRISIEGGDIMMISPNHLIVGCSERTTASAVDAIIHRIFSIPGIGIEKVSVVKIPMERTIMHIDTIFTQVSRDAWVMFGEYSDIRKKERDAVRVDFSKQFSDAPEEHTTKVIQFRKAAKVPYQQNGEGIVTEVLPGLESLLRRISTEDFGVHPSQVKVVYSGGNVFPFDEREQWTDSCNVVALKEGVVIGYDRNEKTEAEFRKVLGFNTITAEALIAKFESGEMSPDQVEKTLILLPSTELSRARGGSHCMSMPLLRESI